jgi:hypothetical protein
MWVIKMYWMLLPMILVGQIPIESDASFWDEAEETKVEQSSNGDRYGVDVVRNVVMEWLPFDPRISTTISSILFNLLRTVFSNTSQARFDQLCLASS